jgi:hypothetical protein
MYRDVYDVVNAQLLNFVEVLNSGSDEGWLGVTEGWTGILAFATALSPIYK